MQTSGLPLRAAASISSTSAHGVVLGCLPTKGLALPFLSYGGSAMLAALAQVGVLLALARETA